MASVFKWSSFTVFRPDHVCHFGMTGMDTPVCDNSGIFDMEIPLEDLLDTAGHCGFNHPE